MIEIVFREDQEEEFQKAIKHAIYFSNRTRLVVLPDEFSNLVPEDNKGNHIYDDKPTIKFDGKKFIISGANSDLKYFLGVFTSFGDEISLKSLQEVYGVLDNHLITAEQDVIDAFTKLDADATFEDLICSGHKFRINGKTRGFEDVFDVKLSDVFENITLNKNVTIKNVNVHLVLNSKDSKGRPYIEMFGQYNEDNEVIDLTLRSYGKNANLMKALNNADKVNVKMANGKPADILPEGFTKVDSLYNVSPSKDDKTKKLIGKLPVALFRMAYYEYKIRELLNQ